MIAAHDRYPDHSDQERSLCEKTQTVFHFFSAVSFFAVPFCYSDHKVKFLSAKDSSSSMSLFIGTVYQSFYRILSVGCYKQKGKHPFLQTYFRSSESSYRQFQEHFVPSFTKLYRNRNACRKIFVFQRDLIAFLGVVVLPFRRCYLPIVYKNAALPIIPSPLRWRPRCVHCRA